MLLLLLTTSVSICLEHSRNLGSTLLVAHVMSSKLQRIAGDIWGDCRPGDDRIDDAKDDTGMKRLLLFNDLEHHALIHVNPCLALQGLLFSLPGWGAPFFSAPSRRDRVLALRLPQRCESQNLKYRVTHQLETFIELS